MRFGSFLHPEINQDPRHGRESGQRGNDVHPAVGKRQGDVMDHRGKAVKDSERQRPAPEGQVTAHQERQHFPCAGHVAVAVDLKA